MGGLQTSVEKAGKLSRVGQIKIDIARLKRELNRIFTRIGSRVYKLMTTNLAESISVNSEIRSLRVEADQLNREIVNLQNELNDLQNPDNNLPGADDEHEFI